MKRGHKIKIDQHNEQYDPQGTLEFPLEAYFTDLNAYTNHCVPIHWHQQIELLTVYSGTIRVVGNNFDRTLVEGQGCFINSGILHGIFPADDHNHQVIDVVFSPSLLKIDSATYNNQFINSILMSDIKIRPLFNKHLNSLIEHIFQSSRNKNDTMQMEIMSDLLAFWLNFYISQKSFLNNTIQPTQKQIVHSLLEFITRNYAKNISICYLARNVGISQRECYRIFKRELGTTPHQYILNYQVVIAAQLLRHTNRKILQIALDTGFSSSNHFSTAFKKHYGITPKEYRRNMK